MVDKDPQRLEVTVDPNRCVGSTLCVMVAKGTFKLGPGGQATVLEPIGDEAAKVRNAAVQCPMAAITVRDSDTGELLFPPQQGGPAG